MNRRRHKSKPAIPGTNDTGAQRHNQSVLRKRFLSVVLLLLAGVVLAFGINHLWSPRQTTGRRDSRDVSSPDPSRNAARNVTTQNLSGKDNDAPGNNVGDALPGERPADDQPRRPDAAALKQEALDVPRKVMADFPDQPDALGLMGVACSKLGQQTEAMLWYQRALDLNPRLAEAHYRMGEAAQGRGEYEPAVKHYRKALEIYPELPDANARLGEALMALGRPAEAVAALETELKNYPDAVVAELPLGRAYIQLRKYDEAIPHLKRAAAHLPEDPRPYYALATACARLGERDKAVTFNQTFRRLKAAEVQARRELRKDDQDVVVMAEIAAEIHAAAGQVYAVRGRQKTAEDHWLRAAFLDKENPLCRHLLAETYMRRKQWPEALELCTDLVRIDPTNAVYHLNTGVALASLLRLEESEKAIRQALRLNPGMIEAYHALLQVLMHRDRKLPEAKAVAEELVLLAPSADNYALLAHLCRQTGDRAGERAASEQARKLAP